ncbi:MAG TPA: PorT family protein [Bacteroidetes bacterium]|nr:PorT family protein [Bacteroidota bacterium]
MKALLRTTGFAMAFIFAINLSAQEFSLGIKTGVQAANVKVPGFISDINAIPDFRSITAVNVGVVSEIGFNEHFAVQPELNYTQKGFQIKEDFGLNLFDLPLPLGVTAISKFHYLEMPLLAKAKFGNETANFYLLAGPTIGYAMSGNLITRARVLVEVDLFNTPINLDAVGYNRWEIGGMAGAGVSFNVGNGNQLFLDARYSHGFSQAYDIPVVRERVRHNSVGVNVGFMMPIGKRKVAAPRA